MATLTRPLPRQVPADRAEARLRDVFLAVGVLVLSAITLLPYLGDPSGPVWDEGYYTASTQRYEEGRAQFGTHPPLGLMLLAAGDAALGPAASPERARLGDDKHVDADALPTGYSPLGMRLASALAGMACALLLFALVRSLAGSPVAASVAASLWIFDTAVVAHLRAAHLEGFQLAFALLALWAFVAAARGGPRRGLHQAGVGAAGAMALLVKLNAAWLLVPAAVLVLHSAWQLRTMGAGLGRTMAGAAATAGRMAGTGLLVTALVLALQLLVGHRPPDISTPAGRQDDAFITGAYRQYLDGARGMDMAVLGSAASAQVAYMADDVRGVTLHDANGSAPWQWLLQQRPISYRWDSWGAQTAYVQLVPNPVGWLLAAIAPLALAGLLLARQRRAAPAADSGAPRWVATTLLLTWLGCFLLHLAIASQRVMYLYHGLSGLLLGIVLAATAWPLAARRWPWLHDRPAALVGTLLALQLAAFVWLSPLALHRPLDHAACERRNLPLHVVECQP